MADSISILKTTDRAEQYENLLPQIKALISGEPDDVANMANVAAALKEGLGFFWVGFYRVLEDQLVLGPFQGPIACTRIHRGKGVCGKAWSDAQTVIVPDVEQFPGHIACSSDSKSEIVLPVIRNNEVIAVLDVDSDQLADFNETDQKYLEELCSWF